MEINRRKRCLVAGNQTNFNSLKLVYCITTNGFSSSNWSQQFSKECDKADLEFGTHLSSEEIDWKVM